MRGDEKLTRDRRVHPLPAAICATQESTFVDEDTTPELDDDIAEDKQGLEPQVDGHLLAEHLLGEHVGLLLHGPVETSLARVYALLRTTILVGLNEIISSLAILKYRSLL